MGNKPAVPAPDEGEGAGGRSGAVGATTARGGAREDDEVVVAGPGVAAAAALWEGFGSLAAGLKSTQFLVRDAAAKLATAPSTQRLRRRTLAGPELELAAFVAASRPVDFTQVLPREVLLHVARFLDGEDLVALERTCLALQEAMSSVWLWQQMLERKRRQITFVPFIGESQRVPGCRNWEEKHRYFRSSVWNSVQDLSQALLVAEHSPLGGEIHLLSGTYRSLLLEGWPVDLSIIGHGGDVVIENTSAWRPPIHICSESSLNPSTYMLEHLSYVAQYIPSMPESLSRISPVGYMLPSYLSGLLRKPAVSPTIVLEGLRVQVGASADTISTFPIYVEGQTHVVVHRCVIVGQRLSAVLVSKGAQCDVIDSDVGGAAEDGVFYVFGGGSVRGCRIHDCAMNAVEVRGASRDVVIENNVFTANGCGLHVPWRRPGAGGGREAATGLLPAEAWAGKIHLLNNRVMDNVGPSLRIEKCGDNPHMGRVEGNTLRGNAEQRPKSAAMQRALDRGLCTRAATGDSHDDQPWFECLTCKLDSEHAQSGVCQSCVSRCHAGHRTFQLWTHTRAFCDCLFAPGGCACQE